MHHSCSTFWSLWVVFLWGTELHCWQTSLLMYFGDLSDPLYREGGLIALTWLSENSPLMWFWLLQSPGAVSRAFPYLYLVVNLPVYVSDLLLVCLPQPFSIAMLSLISRLSSEGSRAIFLAGRRRSALFQPATPVKMFLCVRDFSAPKQVSAVLRLLENHITMLHFVMSL